MIKRDVDIMPFLKWGFILGFFYIVWNAFFSYKSFYSLENSFQAMFTNYFSLDHLTPFYLKYFSRFWDILKSSNKVSEFIIFCHFLSCLLFYALFDRKKPWPWATVFFIFSPFVFYDLSIQDYRHSLSSIVGVLYLWLVSREENFKFKNTLLLFLLVLGAFIDLTFLLFPLVELFMSSKNRFTFVRLLLPALLAAMLVSYDKMIMESLKPLSELSFAAENSGLFNQVLFFLNAGLEFWLGLAGFGFQLMERELYLRELVLKILFLAAIVLGARKVLKTTALGLLVWMAFGYLFYAVFKSQTTVFALLGTYANQSAVKASLFSSLFILLASRLDFSNQGKKLGFTFLFGALLAWFNVINNSSVSNSNIYRLDAPVFWGVIKNNELKFSRKFRDLYPLEYQDLPMPDKLFANGLKEIDKAQYQAYRQERKKKNSLLDVFVYTDLGLYREAQEILGLLYLEQQLSPQGFRTVEAVVNTSFGNRLQTSIVPLMYELLRQKESKDVAESLFLLSLVQFTESGNTELTKVLLNEFGSIFKPKK